MKLGIILYSHDAETVWNAFRLANFSLKQGDDVTIFLLAKGVEYEALDNEKFNVKEQAESLLKNHGHLLACGTCLKIRNATGSEMCPLSTMNDLYELIKISDTVLTF